MIDCASATITVSAISDISYVLGDPSATSTIGVWTLSESRCGPITYSLTYQDGTSVNAGLITLSRTNLIVSSSTASFIGTHNLRVKATFFNSVGPF